MKILYKITNSLVVLAIIPSLIFLPLFRFIAVVEMNSQNQLLSLFGSFLDINTIIANATGIDIENLPEFYTIPELVQLIGENAANGSFSQFDTSFIPENVAQFFIAAFALLCFALLCAVLVLFFGLFTKKKLLTASFSAVGFLSTIAANECFSYIADQLVSGKISALNILKGLESLKEYETYIDLIDFDIRIFELSTAYTALLVIFGALFIISVGFKLAESAQNN